MASRSKSLSLLTVLLLALNNSSASLADEKSADEGPTLTIGSPAPELDIEHWVSIGKGKFKPVTKFEKGKVYVDEFWATWRDPCVQSMPHLAEIQKKYADKGVQIVSVSDEDLETVQEFLKTPLQGDECEEDNEKEALQPRMGHEASSFVEHAEAIRTTNKATAGPFARMRRCSHGGSGSRARPAAVPVSAVQARLGSEHFRGSTAERR